MNLNNFLNRNIECKCGKIHSTNLKLIDIEEGATSRLASHIKELGYHKVFAVCDQNTLKAAAEAAFENLDLNGIDYDYYVYEDLDLIPDEYALGRLFQALNPDADLILAIGSGTINDICKFTSFQMKKDYMVFASAPSMDGFVSIGAALVKEHVKTTYNAHVPIAVIGDPAILAKAPMEMIASGLGDILGKYTCLLDWKMAHLIEKEYYCDWIEDLVRQAIETCVKESDKIVDRNEKSVKAIMEALLLTGIAMSFVGNSRPASGSEHHLSHYWEMQFQMENKKPILHGIKVSIGLICSLKMYYKLLEENPDFKAIKQSSFDYDAWQGKVISCYKDAAKGILELEKNCQKNSLEKRNARLDVMKENWPLICKRIEEDLPRWQVIIEILKKLNSPTTPFEIGVDKKLVEDAIVLAKEVRNRYTILQMLWDMGLLDSYAKEVANSFE